MRTPQTPHEARTLGNHEIRIDKLEKRVQTSTLDTSLLYIPKLCWWKGWRIYPVPGAAACDPTDSPGTRDAALGGWKYIAMTRTENNPASNGRYRDPYNAFYEDVNEFGGVRGVGINRPGIYLFHYRCVINNGLLNPTHDATFVSNWGYATSTDVNVVQIWGRNFATADDDDVGEATGAQIIRAATDDGSLTPFQQATESTMTLEILSGSGTLPDHTDTTLGLGPTDGGYCIAYRHDGVAPLNVQAVLTVYRLGDATNENLDYNQEANTPYSLNVAPTVVTGQYDVTLDVDGTTSAVLTTDFAAGDDGTLAFSSSSFTGVGGSSWYNSIVMGTTPGDNSIFSADGTSTVPPFDTTFTPGSTTVSIDSGRIKLTNPAFEFASAGVVKLGMTLPDTWSLQFSVERDADAGSFATIGINGGADSIEVLADASTNEWTLTSEGNTVSVGTIPANSTQQITITVTPHV